MPPTDTTESGKTVQQPAKSTRESELEQENLRLKRAEAGKKGAAAKAAKQNGGTDPATTQQTEPVLPAKPAKSLFRQTMEELDNFVNS